MAMAEKKTTNAKKKTKKESTLLPFDKLPLNVRRNRKNLYEYIRTGELPE